MTPIQVEFLEEALQKFRADNLTWLIDIKEPGHDSELQEILEANGVSPERNNAILLGLHAIIKQYENSGFPLAYCAGFKREYNAARFIFGHAFILDRCDDLGTNVKHLVLPSPFLRESLIKDAKARGLTVWSYSVTNQPDHTQEYHDWLAQGVTGLIVDDLPSGLGLLKEGTSSGTPNLRQQDGGADQLTAAPEPIAK